MEDKKSYYITGLGEVLPLTVIGGTHDIFEAARSICLDEKRLTIEETARRGLDVPSRVVQKRPAGPMVIRTVDATATAHNRSGIPPHRPYRAQTPSTMPLTTKAMALLAAARSVSPYWSFRLRNLIATITRSARPGALLLHGTPDIVTALGRKLRRSGYDCIILPTRNDRSPTAANSQEPDRLLDYLTSSFGSLQSVGALVFVGDDDFTTKIETIFDVINPPPLIVGRTSGSYEIIPQVLPAFRTETPLPKISIVGVSFNQAKYLEESIRSVIDQNYPALEYIMIDGGSTDGSVEIINKYSHVFAHVIIEKDDGQSEALNKGFRLATGAIMNWLCSDDLLMPGSLFNLGHAYRRHGTDFIAGGCLRVNERSDEKLFHHYSTLPLGRTVQIDPYDILKFMSSWRKGNYFFQPDIFFSKRIWDLAGGYVKQHLYYLMDYDMWLRMGLAGATARGIVAPVGCSRVQADQKTRDDAVNLHEAAALFDEYEELFENLSESAS